MWNIPLQEQLYRIPRLDETENAPTEEKLIYLHFFIGAALEDYDNVKKGVDPGTALR